MTALQLCALCRQEAELVESHILSKWTYRRARKVGGDSDPYIMEGARVHSSSRQKKEPLLCQVCDQRFGRHEEYVASITWTPKRRCLLVDHVLGAGLPDSLGYSLVRPAFPFDVDAIARFGLSTFWRADVSRLSGLHVALGPYSELLRRYLEGEALLDERFALVVHAVDPRDTNGEYECCTAGPVGDRQAAGYHAYELLVFGMVYLLYVGQKVPEWARQRCFVHAPDAPVFLTLPKHLSITSRGLALFKKGLSQMQRRHGQ